LNCPLPSLIIRAPTLARLFRIHWQRRPHRRH